MKHNEKHRPASIGHRGPDPNLPLLILPIPGFQVDRPQRRPAQREFPAPVRAASRARPEAGVVVDDGREGHVATPELMRPVIGPRQGRINMQRSKSCCLWSNGPAANVRFPPLDSWEYNEFVSFGVWWIHGLPTPDAPCRSIGVVPGRSM